MLRLQQVTKCYGDKRAVDGVTAIIPKGQLVGIIGRSGAGKSTLLRMINRLETVSEGRIVYEQTDIGALRGRRLRAWRARCAMIFQQFNLVGRLDVLTNVLIGRSFRMPTGRALLKLWSDEDKATALAALDRFDMAHLASQRADTLSGGQQQRVAIARALVQNPDIILADEPVASLDPRNTQRVMDALQSINRDLGITVMCNLHSLDLAREYCDRLLGLAAGRLVLDETPDVLSNERARELYGLEADDAVGHGDAPAPVPIAAYAPPRLAIASSGVRAP
ncbi:MAG: phosphonate ABC transporter ATP-binding protein [Alphaproteobacteria bacterium]|nr:phosphonate ABC transporter ATP-binding protein [Alphaproteobacteria bacterium]